MREIYEKDIIKAVKEAFISANYNLPEDTCKLIHSCKACEKNPLAKSILQTLEDNIDASRELDLPLCQDTGMAVVFAEIGVDAHICCNFENAVNEGVRQAYGEGYLRKSVVESPLYDRKNTGDNTPAIIHTRMVDGDKIKLVCAPKGFGSENMSRIKMFTPNSTEAEIIEFVKETVVIAGSNPCPPIVIGIGIGGSFDYAPYLAKKALCRDVSNRNSDARYAQLEDKILNEVNKLDIGPQGFGGETTALAVNIETYPTHIAGLPVAVNINCHVARHVEVIV